MIDRSGISDRDGVDSADRGPLESLSKRKWIRDPNGNGFGVQVKMESVIDPSGIRRQTSVTRSSRLAYMRIPLNPWGARSLGGGRGFSVAGRHFC